MASAFAHLFTAVALGVSALPRRRRGRVIALGVFCSVLPDLDVIGLALGLPYDHWLGHRGITHSLPFALLLSMAIVAIGFRAGEWQGLRGRLLVYLFVVGASHGLLDGMTDGGLGVAFLSPFDETRHFLPFRPVAVSPIGLSAFFGLRALDVLAAELLWIWLPVTALALLLHRVVPR